MHTDFETPPIPSREKVFRTCEAQTTVEWVYKLLADHSELYQSQEVLKEDTARVASYVNTRLASLIRDRFEYPKDCTRASVIDRYHLIFKHDRAWRLADAQE